MRNCQAYAMLNHTDSADSKSALVMSFCFDGVRCGKDFLTKISFSSSCLKDRQITSASIAVARVPVKTCTGRPRRVGPSTVPRLESTYFRKCARDGGVARSWRRRGARVHGAHACVHGASGTKVTLRYPLFTHGLTIHSMPGGIVSISMPGAWRDTGHKALCPVSATCLCFHEGISGCSGEER
eukprot:COSAG02_NODE_6618_length_3455_cov_4.183850_1_plen_183_part_00